MVNKETVSSYSKESGESQSYREFIEKKYAGRGIWDYLRYDESGFLRLRSKEDLEGARLIDFVKFERTPFQIVDLRILKERIDQWKEMSKRTAERVGFKGNIELVYAMKADPSASVVLAAASYGCGIEFSSQVDLMKCNFLHDRGLLSDNRLYVCNGLKISPEVYPDLNGRLPAGFDLFSTSSSSLKNGNYEESYSKMIASFAQQVANKGGMFVSVIDSESEVNIFAQPGEVPPTGLDVGVRFKLYGVAYNDSEQARLVARHGMNWETILKVSERIKNSPHLRLKMFHAMVSAAGSKPVDEFVNTLLYSFSKHLELKAKCPSLTHFNIGGGMEPYSEDYNHQEFLEKLLSGMKKMAENKGINNKQDLTLVFEFGSLISAEAGHHLVKVVEVKSNSVDKYGNPESWYIIDGSPMRMVPDIAILGKQFPILPLNYADRRVKKVRVGGLTCDSDDVYPTDTMEEKGVELYLPEVTRDDDLHLAFVADKAYGEQLTGVKGGGHSGQIEPGTIIIFQDGNGKVRVRREERQTARGMMKLFGFADEELNFLRQIAKK